MNSPRRVRPSSHFAFTLPRVRLFNTAINSGDSKNANAHYYLASAYLRLDNKRAALDEYRLSLKLDSRGQSAKFCKQAIEHLEGVHTSSTSKLQATQKSESSAKNSDPILKTYPVFKISGLPVIPPVIKDDGPTLSEILLWTLNQQSAYYQTAFNRKNQALARLDEVNEILKKAESLASSAVPNARSYGESEDEWKKRIENGRTQFAAILEPYKAAVDSTTKTVEQTNSIYETCISAGRRLSGY